MPVKKAVAHKTTAAARSPQAAAASTARSPSVQTGGKTAYAAFVGTGGKTTNVPKRILRKGKYGGAIQGISKPAIRRLARRGGCRRISGLIYDESRGVLKNFLSRVIQDSITYMEHAQRKTLTAKDVVFALKRQGKTIYGFGY